MAQQTPYRPSKPLPVELQDHLAILLEEKLYTASYTLLNGLVAANPSLDERSPAFTPSPTIIALFATVAIHPATTHRAPPPDGQQSSTHALHFLHDLLHSVGPLHADFSTALSFRNAAGHVALPNVKKRKKRNSDETSPLQPKSDLESECDSSDDDDDDDASAQERINNELAGSSSVFSRAEGFWHLVGWSFNSAVAHPVTRWPHYKNFLSLMLDVIESDWSERKHRAQRDMESPLENESLLVEASDLKESIACRYISEYRADGRTGLRKIMRAILADGSDKSMQEFGEIWRNETRLRKKQHDTTVSAHDRGTRQKLDIEAGEFGDYGREQDTEDDDEKDVGRDSDVRTKRARRNRLLGPEFAQWKDVDMDRLEDGQAKVPARTKDEGNPQEDSQDRSAMPFRRRLIALLAQVSAYLPQTVLPLEELLQIFTEFIRPLPLSTFTALISTPPPVVYHNHDFFPNVARARFFIDLLTPLLATSNKIAYAYSLPTQRFLETDLLPCPIATQSIVDAAKAQAVLEALVRLLWRDGALQNSSNFEKAVQDGIEARWEKCAPKRRGKTDKTSKLDQEAEHSFKASAARLKLMTLTKASAST